MAYKTIIGLEIHVELMSKQKIFCNCPNEYGAEPNTLVCPVCLGLPGSMPVLDKEALTYGIKAGLAFNSKIANIVKMDRKNYFYSDLTKGYQISQDDIPICSGGYIEIQLKDGPKKINLERIHIEEDTGKQLHTEDGASLLDFNRSGVPLIEVVTKPDINSSEEAKLFLESLRATLKYIGISDVKMEEGSLRCDVNINVKDTETGEKTNITEIKNLNSFSGAVKAIEFEENRHKELLEKGENTDRETRRWDDAKFETIVMRKKGGTENYRFAVDGDIALIDVADEWIEQIKDSLPELPHHKKARFINEYSLSEYTADVLTQSKEVAHFFEDTIRYIADTKLVSNWIMGDVLRGLNEVELEIEDIKFTSKDLAELLTLIKEEKINDNTGKKVLKEMFESGKSPEVIVHEKGLIQISDESALSELVEEILSKNEQSIIDYRNGKDRAIGFLVGQIMKASKGKANPQMVNKILMGKLNK